MEPDLNQTLATGELKRISDQPFHLGGRDVLYVGITVTIYMSCPFVDGINEKLCQCMSEYLQLAPEPPRLAALPVSKQWIDLTQRGVISPSEGIAKVGDRRAWDAIYVWAKGAAGAPYQDGENAASPWSIEVVRGASDQPRALSYFHVSFPMSLAADPRLPQLVQRWSERLQVFHGYAGAALLLPSSRTAFAKLDSFVYEASRRFPGLNVENPASQRGPLAKGIKTVDWLTLLGQDFVERLGGLRELESHLRGRFGVTPLANGGVMIQAGSMPELGDMARGERPKLYVDLNRELKVVRVLDYPYAFQSGQFTQNSMNREAARAWIARFDD